jgi:hypothetical protein
MSMHLLARQTTQPTNIIKCALGDRSCRTFTSANGSAPVKGSWPQNISNNNTPNESICCDIATRQPYRPK